jgi:hypothetical protein
MVVWATHLGRISWWREHVEEAFHFMEDRKQRDPSGLLLPTRPHLLKFPESPKIVLPAEDQVSNALAYEYHFTFKPFTEYMSAELNYLSSKH